MIGRAYCRVFDYNDFYFQGVIDRQQNIPGSVSGPYGEGGDIIWDGWHLLEGDATLLNYGLENVSGTIRVHYDNVQIADKTTDGWWTHSLAAKDPGLYRFHIDVNGGSCTVHAPYTAYTGGLSYQNATGSWSGAAGMDDFDKIVANDLYFQANNPRQPAGQSVAGVMTRAGNYQTIWEGCTQYYSNYRRVWYKVSGGNVTPGKDVYLQLLYSGEHLINPGGSPPGQLLPNEPDYSDYEGYVDLSGAYTDSELYHMVARLYRANSSDRVGYGAVNYVYVGPASATALVNPGARTVGASVGASLDGLATNDQAIYGRLIRRDYAVRKSEYPGNPGKFSTWRYYLKRRGDFLYYRGLGGKIVFAGGKKSAALQDVGEDTEGGYLVKDLNQVKGLHRGMDYEIHGSMEYAMER